MNKPPITLFHPSYVIEYASTTDSAINFTDMHNLNVNSQLLGVVPKLAICLDIEINKYVLAHCSTDWDVLSGVESRDTIEAIKLCAEKHYTGISTQWIKTHYKKEGALNAFDEKRKETTCSFCGKNSYDQHFSSLVAGKNAKICNICVNELKQKRRLQ